MTNYLDNEGKPSTGTKKTPTNEWLKTNNLSHLIPTFTQNNISLSELADMDRDELTEILKALGLDAINIPRIRSKIIKLKQKDSKQPQQVQIQHVIITEAEQLAMMSLNDKFEELKVEHKSIESAIDDLKKTGIKQQKNVNGAFNEIISNIEKRRNILLNDINNKTKTYINQLNQELQQNANNRKSLIKTQTIYNDNMKQSAQPTSAVISSSYATVQQRANKNVKMIDEVLLQMQLLNEKNQRETTKDIQFNINKTKIIKAIQLWGDVTINGDKLSGVIAIKGDKLPSPTVALMRRDNCHTALIEILLHESIKVNATKYEIELYKGTMDDIKEMETNKKKKKLKKRKKFEVDVLDDNIAYYEIKHLKEGTKYSVRARAFVDQKVSEYSQWISFQTDNEKDIEINGYDDDYEDAVEEYWVEHIDGSLGNINLSKWITVTETMNLGLSEYKRKRLFHGLVYYHNSHFGLSYDMLQESWFNTQNKDFVHLFSILKQFFLTEYD